MFMILNLAVGGDGGGLVPSNFTSATMLVDYVRVWLSCDASCGAGVTGMLLLGAAAFKVTDPAK